MFGEKGMSVGVSSGSPSKKDGDLLKKEKKRRRNMTTL